MTKFNIPRSRLRELGVPEDLTADDVVELFSLPDDDDRMHMQTRREGPDRRCAHGKLFTESCPECGYVHPRDRTPPSLSGREK